MATSSQRPYQGYPYVNPPVIDAPSISADDAAKWHHLPRRPVELNVKREAPSDAPDLQGQSAFLTKRDSDQAPVVYIDLPETSGGVLAERQCIEDTFEIIDTQPQLQGSRPNYKRDLDTPVVYIDLPEADGSDVARSREQTPDEPAFVQETIFYDPFENRRIDRAKEESDDDSEINNYNPRLPRRPNHLDLIGAGPSGGSSTQLSSTSTSFMTKEAEIYGRRDGDFPASPIPVSQFPEPPPAYAEIDARFTPVAEPEPRPTSPPKTQVILPRDSVPMTPMETQCTDRKFLNCQHCGLRVHTLVVRKTGRVTHVAAASCFLIACCPAVIFIYCTDYFKVKNHYCPNCNRIIGYQQPFIGDAIVYINSS